MPNRDEAPKWHLVESVVADAAVTRCGRRMEPVTGRGDVLEVLAPGVEPARHERCLRCEP